MYRPGFPLMSVNHVDVQMGGKTISTGHTSSLSVGPSLCEDGHPYVADPVTGRKMCTCSLATEIHYDHRVLMSDARKQGMSLSGSVGPPSVGLDASAFYSPLVRGLSIRQDRLPPYLTSGIPGQPMTFDPALSTHPYGLLYAGMDVNGGPIRKAATRETTGPLKIWLSEHKKNPYPTKAEKIMLAIITRMTLTQVSTWFANARRRLKKENKLYPADRENTEADDDDEDIFNDSSHGAGNTSKSAGSEQRLLSESDAEDINVDLSDCSDIDDDVSSPTITNDPGQGSSNKTHPDVDVHPARSENRNKMEARLNNEQQQYSQVKATHVSQRPSTAFNIVTSPSNIGYNKPKIWSISEIISGPSASKDSQGQATRTSSLPLQTNTSLALTNEIYTSSSSSSFRQGSPPHSVTMTSSPLTSSPYSSSLSSSSSPVSPTTFRPFPPVMGVSSFLLHRPDLTGFVSRYGLPVVTNALPYDRSSIPTVHRRHIDTLSRGAVLSKEILTESKSVTQNCEDGTSETNLNKHSDKIGSNERTNCDLLEAKSPRCTHRAEPNNPQFVSMSKNSIHPSIHRSTTDSIKVTGPHSSKPERVGHWGLRDGDRADQCT